MEKRHWKLTTLTAAVLTGAISASGATNQMREPERLVLKLVDTFNLFSSGHSAVVHHVDELFAGIDIAIDWQEQAETALPGKDRAERRVYLRNNRPKEIGLGENVLGAVLSNRDPQRVLYIFTPAVANVVGVRLSGMRSADAERKLAIALARVIVHEAFHAIAPQLPHARRGITAAGKRSQSRVRQLRPSGPYGRERSSSAIQFTVT